MSRVWSKYQQDIFKVYNTTNKNIVIAAAPGSGKTSTIVELLKQTSPYKKAIFLCFNKSIADELSTKVPQNTKASTIHSLGIGLLYKCLNRKIKITEYKNFSLAKKHLKISHIKPDKQSAFIFTLSRMVDLYRINLGENYDDLVQINDKYGLLEGEQDLELTWELINKIDEYNLREDHQEFMVDFTDMLFLPLFFKDRFTFPKYDVVFVDECLPYHIPVITSDYKSISIGNIVENKLPVEVLTYNEKTGNQEFKKIVNWSRSLNNKKMYKINFKGIENKYHNYTFLVCTYNHKIYIKDLGYLMAEDLKVGMIAQLETLAEKTQKYKITQKGKDVLSECMNIKNQSEGNKCHKFNKILYKNRGGNGRINELQQKFCQDLISFTDDDDWKMELVVKTDKESRETGSPNHYKIDIGNERRKIAIEIDGNSHQSEIVREKDFRKDFFLRRNGWTVKRIKNIELVRNYETILEQLEEKIICEGDNCIKDVIITSIEETYTNEKWVYDIEVEDNHNFYANGILVHNCQDLSLLQKKLIDQIIKPRTGRFVSVGDQKQTIYTFIGANKQSFREFVEAPNTIELPLSVSYRCPKKVIEEANKVFEGVEAFEGNIDGEVVYDGDIDEAVDGDMILCRNNLPLVELFLRFLRQGKKAIIFGKEYEKGLLYILNKIDTKDKEEAFKKMDELLNKASEDLKAKGVFAVEKHPKYQALLEKITILKIISRSFNDFSTVDQMLSKMFSDDTSKGIILSTIHKMKGKENDVIYFFLPSLIPSKYAETQEELFQEKCLYYVCLTRAKKKLIYVNN